MLEANTKFNISRNCSIDREILDDEKCSPGLILICIGQLTMI